MHSTSAGSSKKRGHYATRACNGCRRRRCKCDGVHPTCGTCTFYGHECTWSREDDARRPATKQLVETLRTKIQVLEAEVARLQAQANVGEAVMPLPGSAFYPTGSWNQPEAVGRLPEGSIDSNTLIPASLPVVTGIEHSSLDSQSDLPYTEYPPTNVVSRYVSQPTYEYIHEINTSIPIEELPEGARLSLICDWNRHLPSETQLSRHEHDLLIQRFFAYQVVWLFPLVQDVFLHNMLYAVTQASSMDIPMPYYSPVLHCSILAFATALSDDPKIRSEAVRDKFAAKAKQLLDNDFARPAPCLVQALAILAEYCCGIGERDAGYMYLGMSARAAQAIGLFVENQPGAAIPAGVPLEPMVRGWISWSLFSQDKLMALEYGRSYDVPPPPPGATLPVVDPEFDSRPWLPLLPQPPAGADATPNRTTLVFRESCKLMVILTRIIDIFVNDPGPNGVPEDNTVITLHLQLDTWFNNLPREMLISARSNSTPLPHVIMINICYWWALMYLHRPFYQLGQTLGHANRDAQLFADLSIKMCDRGAQKIVQLIKMFDQAYGMRYFPRKMLQIIITCGTTLLLQTATTSESAIKKRSVAQEGINVCLRALREIASTWSCAAKLVEQLEAPLSEQLRQPSVGSSSVSPTYPADASAEHELDDQEVSNLFYRFVHEWNRDEPGSPYSSGLHSQESSPMLSSAYTTLGEPPGEPLSQVSWDQAQYPTSPLSHHGVLAPQLPGDPFGERGL